MRNRELDCTGGSSPARRKAPPKSSCGKFHQIGNEKRTSRHAFLDKITRNGVRCCGSSKLNAAESLMQEAPPWKAVLCMAWSSTALGVPGSARERLGCPDPGVNLPPILTAKEFSSELEIVRPRLCSGDADHRVAARSEEHTSELQS